jgi:prevent-host-death family protein
MNMAIKDFRDDMADPINRAAYSGERVILTRRGQGIAALVSMDDLALLEELENQADLKAAIKARKEAGGVSLAQIKARLANR